MVYKAVVVGGGPGGYVAAIRMAQLGGKVALVEEAALGGTCLNRGCIPTKALVAAVDRLKAVQEAAAFGITVGEPAVDFDVVQTRKTQVVEKLVGGVQFLLNKHKVEVIAGRGKISAPGMVEVTANGATRGLKCENIIVATGSGPALIKALGYNGRTIITSEEALQLPAIPESLLIVGAGVIGCEFAHIFSGLGSRITMVEALPRILALQDRDISRRLQSLFKRRKISIKTNVAINKIEEDEGGIRAELADGDVITAEKALISIGRVLNTGGLGLDEPGVALGDRGQIAVDDRMRTNVPGIYAIGDVVMKYQLAHVASAQGIVAAENIMGRESVMDYSAVPSAIFTNPEIASVGMTEQEAKEHSLPVKTGKFSFLASGKAVAMAAAEGLVKIVAHAETGVVLGVHIIGPHASDLIAEATLAVGRRMTAHELAHTIHAHPTLAEAVMEATDNVYGLGIHG